MFVSGNAKGRCTIVGPEVGGVLSLDVERYSVSEIEDAVVRASEAGSLVSGNSVVVGGTARIAAATTHPLRPLLAGREYRGRRFTVAFTRVRVTNVLRTLALVAGQPFEVTEGVEDRISVGAWEARWDEVLDLLALANNLTAENVNGIIRVWRRGESSPRFVALDSKFVDDAGMPQAEPVRRCAASLDEHESSRLHLDAVITGPPPMPVAFVRYPNGSHAMLRKGQCTGSAGGSVSRIERSRLVITGHSPAADGAEAVAERVLTLDGE